MQLLRKVGNIAGYAVAGMLFFGLIFIGVIYQVGTTVLVPAGRGGYQELRTTFLHLSPAAIIQTTASYVGPTLLMGFGFPLLVLAVTGVVWLAAVGIRRAARGWHAYQDQRLRAKLDPRVNALFDELRREVEKHRTTP